MCIALCTNIPDLADYTADLNIGGVEKHFDDLSSKKLTFNLTAEETVSLPLGFINPELIFTDPYGRKFKALTDTIFEIKSMEEFADDNE